MNYPYWLQVFFWRVNNKCEAFKHVDSLEAVLSFHAFIGSEFHLMFYFPVSPSLQTFCSCTQWLSDKVILIPNLTFKLFDFARFTKVLVYSMFMSIGQSVDLWEGLLMHHPLPFLFFSTLGQHFKKLVASVYLPLHICWLVIISR